MSVWYVCVWEYIYTQRAYPAAKVFAGQSLFVMNGVSDLQGPISYYYTVDILVYGCQ